MGAVQLNGVAASSDVAESLTSAAVPSSEKYLVEVAVFQWTDLFTNTKSLSTVTLSGGVLNHAYRVTNSITTTRGRTDERSLVVRVMHR